MPAEASSLRASVLLGIAVVELALGIAAVFNSVYLIESFDDTVRNATTHTPNLPVDAGILLDGIMPVAIMVPQAIILPAIVGIIAAAAHSRCAHIANLVFELLATLWSPVQTIMVLFFVLCYGFMYAQHLDDGNRHPREELLKVFFCFLGLFLISLTICFLSFASSVAACCILCRCCEARRPPLQARAHWVLRTEGGDTAALLQWAADDESQDGLPPPPYSILMPGQPVQTPAGAAAGCSTAGAGAGGFAVASTGMAHREPQAPAAGPANEAALILLD